MKSVYHQSCDLLLADLREKIYTEQKINRAGKKHVDLDVVFDLKKVASSSERGLIELHLVCYDRQYPTSFMFLAALKPNTREWIKEGSQFTSSVQKFMFLCLEELESRGEEDALRAGLALVEIATKEFARLTK